MTEIPQAEKGKQLAHPVAIGAEGSTTYLIAGLCIVAVSIFLQLWARKTAKVELQIDDLTLITAWVQVPLLLMLDICCLPTWHLHPNARMRHLQSQHD